MRDNLLSRRGFLGTAMASGAALLAGGPAGARSPTRMVMHRSPSCGCCTLWAGHARRAGFEITIQDNRDMTALKRRLGVPRELSSCHTVEVDGYVIEGHVPFQDVRRLLRERPRDTRGLALPGMPIGSPGMEVPGGERQDFVVFAFNTRGGHRDFARHSATHS